jgi:hypothetical protein
MMASDAVAPAAPIGTPSRRFELAIRRANAVRWVLIVLIPVICLGIFAALVRSTPEFYLKRERIDNAAALSNAFLSTGSRWLSEMQSPQKKDWLVRFDERQINGWLADAFEREYAANTLPAGVTQPRVAFEEGLMKVAFRYRFGPLDTVVHTGFKVWVPKRNVVVLELQSSKAGMLPLPVSYVRNVLDTVLSDPDLKYEVQWKQRQGRLCAVIQLPASTRDPTVIRAEVVDANFVLKGQAPARLGFDVESEVSRPAAPRR